MKKDPDHFDRIAVHYQSLRPIHVPLLELLGEILRLQPDMFLLDLGCGPGHDLLYLQEKFGIVPHGVDTSPLMCQQAAAALGSNQVVNTDALSFLQSSPIKFSAVLLKFSLHHISSVSELFKWLTKVLQPGARVAVVTMQEADLESYLLLRYFPTLHPVMSAATRKNEELWNVLSTTPFADCSSTACELGSERLEPELIERVRAKYVSFLSAVSDEEMESAIERMLADMNSEQRGKIYPIRGTIYQARRT